MNTETIAKRTTSSLFIANIRRQLSLLAQGKRSVRDADQKWQNVWSNGVCKVSSGKECFRNQHPFGVAFVKFESAPNMKFSKNVQRGMGSSNGKHLDVLLHSRKQAFPYRVTDYVILEDSFVSFH